MTITRLISLILGVVVVGSVGFFMLSSDDSGNNDELLSTSQEFSETVQGLSFSYDDQLAEQTLAEVDVKDKFIARLTSDNPAMIVSIRYEDDLKSISTLANSGLLELVSSNAIKALPDRYPEYSLMSQQDLSVANRQAKEVIFSYAGPSSAVVTQRLVIIQKDTDTAVYASFQASQGEFDMLDQQHFQGVLDTAKFQ